MKFSKITNIAFLLTIGACLHTSHLTAWERTAINDCKKSEQNCKRRVDNCKKKDPKCRKNPATCDKDAANCKSDAKHSDEASFSSSLSDYSQSVFQKFTADQKKKALDFADGNKMPPDDAVAKVAGMCASCKK